MGSVHLETLAQGRNHHDYDYMPLSDPNVVLKLVENRIHVDKVYVERMFPEESPLMSNGGVVFVENIINAYIDLDRAIAVAKMSKGQRIILDLIMYGWSCQDIAKAKGVSHQAVRTQQLRAVDAIVKANNAMWMARNERLKAGDNEVKAIQKLKQNNSALISNGGNVKCL